MRGHEDFRPERRQVLDDPGDQRLEKRAVLREGLRENEVLQAAARHGIVTSGLHDCFHTGPAQSGLLIGFGAVSTTGLPAALRMLDRILASQSPCLAK
jgi:hypothetical protein